MRPMQRKSSTATALVRRPPEGNTLAAQEVIEAEIIEDVVPQKSNRITPLETFIRRRGIKPAHLARESGYSRQHLLRIRMGRMEPTRRCMAAIISAIRRMTHEAVMAGELFDLENDEDVRREVMNLEASSRHALQALSRSKRKLPARRSRKQAES
jgi:hypothetical protein